MIHVFVGLEKKRCNTSTVQGILPTLHLGSVLVGLWIR